MSKLDLAIATAALAHEGQVDKAGEAYILHPLRVMSNFTDDALRIIAVLHDVVEDTSFTLADVHRYFGYRVGTAVDHLTKREGETYMQFVARCCENIDARTVKCQDIMDNMSGKRKPDPDVKAHESRRARYRAALEWIQEKHFAP